MKLVACAVVAVSSLVGAHFVREAAKDEASAQSSEEPYAPSVDSARFAALGYRELFADLFFVRLTGYFGGNDATAHGIGALVDAIVELDPRYHRIYDYGARAMTMAAHGLDQAEYEHALAILDRGMTEFDTDWHLPFLAAEIYDQDLQTTDPALRRKWDERAAILTEAGIRKPGAPAEAATFAASLRTKLGQHQRATDGLREMLLITNDAAARKRIIAKLAVLEDDDADEIASELLEERRRFDAKWGAERPALPASLYLLVGGRLPRRFELADLATGGHDLIGATQPERLEPLQ